MLVDKITIRFKGKHCDKRRITYKTENDGFQDDAWCDAGYTYQVYLRKERAKLDLSPLHSWTMTLFDSMKDDYHQVGMNNLYNSAAAYNHFSWKVLCHGVTRKSARGLLSCVIQEEGAIYAATCAERGTVKAAMLEEDQAVPI